MNSPTPYASIDAVPDMLYVFDREGVLLEYRPPLEGEGLHDDTGIEGKSLEDLFPGDVVTLFRHHLRIVFETGELRHFPFFLQQRSGVQKRHFEVRLVTNSGDNVLAIVRDMTSWIRAREELEAENAGLRVRNEELDSFTHSVAHDLKSPLSLILGYAEMVRDDAGTVETDRLLDYMGSIIFSGRKMTAIIHELLLLASVRREEIQFSHLDMQRIVSDAMHRLDHLIQRNMADVLLPEEWIPSHGYSPWVEEVWVNYIGNAIKHGGPEITVEVGMEKEGGKVRYWVKDNGPGIAPEHLDELFVPFIRLSQAKIEGQGLGLSIVKRIMDKLGGEVAVESEPGRGSRFSFTLPAID